MWTSSQSAMRAVTWCTANLSHNGQESGTHTWQLKDGSFKKKENGFPRNVLWKISKSGHKTEEESALSHIPST